MAKDKKPDTIKIEVHEDKPNLLWPECVAALRCLPAGASNFVEWGYRHPLGMYNVSVENLPRRFGAVLDVLDELRAISLATNPAIADVTTRLLDSQQSLLYAML